MNAQARVLDAIDACHACVDIDEWPHVVFAALSGLVPCDFAAFNDFDPEADRYVAVTSRGAMPDGWDATWVDYGMQNPAYRRVVENNDMGPMRLSDFIDQQALRKTELYRLLYGPMGVNFQIGTALEAPKPQLTALVLNREHRDFTLKEVELVRLIRPHLRRSYDHARTFSGIARDRARLEQAIAAADAAGASSLPLTPREQEVLRAISKGKTNAQAALELHVSERTIAKHLEHVYAKLGVPNRSAALSLFAANPAATIPSKVTSPR
jgi:DNA-binding CsgD family transcriptional regulator